jgi:hypothetical protein
MRLHYKIAEGETVQDVEVMSLYPYVCKYFKFPIGHPVIHVGDECLDIQAMLQKDGLLKCSILPSRQLYHPVLSFRCSNILLFYVDHVLYSRIEPRTARTKRMLKGH